MYLIAIAWLYVALMMAAAEATSSQGSVLGAIFTFVLYGLLPIAVLMYILGTPARRRARLAQERAADAAAQEPAPASGVTASVNGSSGATHVASAVGLGLAAAPTNPSQPDGSSHAAGRAVPPERVEP